MIVNPVVKMRLHQAEHAVSLLYGSTSPHPKEGRGGGGCFKRRLVDQYLISTDNGTALLSRRVMTESTQFGEEITLIYCGTQCPTHSRRNSKAVSTILAICNMMSQMTEFGYGKYLDRTSFPSVANITLFWSLQGYYDSTVSR